MNIEKTEIKNSSINQITKTTVTTENSTKFSDELKDLKNILVKILMFQL
mgnify:CR=1 FL=1